MKEFDLIYIWNKWIEFCKKQVVYDFAQALFFALVAYLIIISILHYILGFDAISSHHLGIVSAYLTFGLLVYIFGKRNGWLKGMLEDLDKEAKL